MLYPLYKKFEKKFLNFLFMSLLLQIIREKAIHSFFYILEISSSSVATLQLEAKCNEPQKL
jgi:hypothetical protein